MTKVLVSLSGGMDSAAVLGKTLEHSTPDEVVAVSFLYGSKHNQYEMAAAERVANYYGVKRQVIDTAPTMLGFNSNLLQSGGPIPEGHYTDKSMAATVVPCRNLIFASILAGLAESLGAEFFTLGVHAGDHAIYPDCRPEFVHALRKAVWEATEKKVTVLAPFIDDTKTTIIEKAKWFKTQVPWNLTRTCYKDQQKACGKCGSCVERLEAFAANGMTDPVEYES
jgi:7-cyano-7-deazaguanine synthase